ncbi:MAG: glycosyltransferase [Thermodesulfobacteriota bacterium]|nr:glycosyltransferase [Thermodesulfobacteriota bacterium]
MIVNNHTAIAATDRSAGQITYYVIPYGVYGGGEIYLENHIKKGTFKHCHLLFPNNNPLQKRLAGVVPCTRFESLNQIGRFLLGIRAGRAAFHNSFSVYHMLRQVKAQNGLHLTEVVHSSLEWEDSMHQADRTDVDRFLVVSAAVAGEFGLDHYTVVPPVIDERRFQVPRQLSEKITVGTVARFAQYKNLTRIVDIAGHTDDDFRFVIIGEDGGRKKEVQQRIQAEGLGHKIFIKDFTPAIESAYAGFDVFLLTSLREGTPLVICEALAAGLPVVTAASGGIPEQMQGQPGILFSLNDSDKEIARQVMQWGRWGREQARHGETTKQMPPVRSGPNIFLGLPEAGKRRMPAQDYRPLVSFYVAAYNCARYISQAVDSVLNQTYKPVEVCICDDGSTDNTREVLESRYGNDDRVRWVRQENAGISAASAAAVGLCRGELLAQLDADDWVDPGFAKEMVAVFAAHPDVGLVYTDNREVDEEGGLINESGSLASRYDTNLLLLRMIVTHGRMFRRSVYEQTPGFDRDVLVQDYDISLKVAEFCQCRHLPRTLYNYRQRGDGMVRSRPLDLVADTEKVVNQSLQRRGLPYRALRQYPETLQLQFFFDPDMFNALSVSVVMVTHNNEATIGRVLDSLEDQLHRPKEIIVADNHSTDKTVAIASGRPACRVITDKSMDGSREDCLARAIQAASGGYIALQAPVLCSRPERLQMQLLDLTRVGKLCWFSGTATPVPQGAVISRKVMAERSGLAMDDIIPDSLMLPRRVARISRPGYLIEDILRRYGESSIVAVNRALMYPA